MRVKIAKCFAVVALAASMCLAPFAQAAYANAIAVHYVGAALASIMAIYGVSPKVDGNVNFNAIGEAYTSFVDGFAGATADVLKDTVSAWDKTLTQDIDWDNIGTTISASTAELARMGEAGVIDLNVLSMSGAFGLLPALLSLFMADQVNTGQGGFASQTLSYSNHSLGIGFADSPTWVYKNLGYNAVWVYDVIFSNGTVYSYYYPDPNVTQVSYSMSNNGFVFGGVSLCLANSDNSYRPGSVVTMPLVGASMVFSSVANVRFYSGNTDVLVISNGTIDLLSPGATLTDNPDVNLGHDYWDDAKANKDILNPAAGASVVGSDLVIDGDYIANRGSLGVITDWADINSWADALARAHAGVAEGALDGTISGTATGTAVNVGTGELVTDAVGELVKPNAGTSLSPSKDFDWGKFLDPSLYLVFPFCLPWDLVELVKTLSAEPQAPVIDWPMPTLTGQQNLHVDLSPWSPVATVLRAGELVVAAVGLIWITKTMIRN